MEQPDGPQALRWKKLRTSTRLIQGGKSSHATPPPIHNATTDPASRDRPPAPSPLPQTFIPSSVRACRSAHHSGHTSLARCTTPELTWGRSRGPEPNIQAEVSDRRCAPGSLRSFSLWSTSDSFVLDGPSSSLTMHCRSWYAFTR
ncbi:hypothetical protein FS749_012362 [Ceratobasidium sp. UAMH 11750]|nr:hypothetical protein FS749_012362 [Ceratobasidium sp. UAMH 11750]